MKKVLLLVLWCGLCVGVTVGVFEVMRWLVRL